MHNLLLGIVGLLGIVTLIKWMAGDENPVNVPLVLVGGGSVHPLRRVRPPGVRRRRGGARRRGPVPLASPRRLARRRTRRGMAHEYGTPRGSRRPRIRWDFYGPVLDPDLHHPKFSPRRLHRRDSRSRDMGVVVRQEGGVMRYEQTGCPAVSRVTLKRCSRGATAVYVFHVEADGIITRRVRLPVSAPDASGVAPWVPSHELGPQDTGSRCRTGFFEREQFESLRAHLPEPLRGVVTFAFLTGWRVPSEVLTLQWRQVDRTAGDSPPGSRHDQEQGGPAVPGRGPAAGTRGHHRGAVAGARGAEEARRDRRARLPPARQKDQPISATPGRRPARLPAAQGVSCMTAADCRPKPRPRWRPRAGGDAVDRAQDPQRVRPL